jgi:peptidyl-dipeptidase Dcp
MTTNPLLTPSNLPHGAPAFDRIKPEHFLPAIESGIAAAKANIDAIKNNSAQPDFTNTLVT